MFQRAVLLPVLVMLAVSLGATPALAEEGGGAEGLTPSPSLLEFGTVDAHFGGSPRLSVHFSNETALAVFVGSPTITGAGASAFQIVNNGCVGPFVEIGQSCSLEVEFHPAIGLQSASLELLAGGVPVAVPLSGSGITGTLSASPDPLSFAAIPYTPPGHEGEYQENEQVNILNSHDAGTQVESVNITGPDASSFSIQYGDCEHNLLNPGNSCDVGVRFAPTSPGPKRASLALSSDSSGTPLVVPLEAEALNGPQVSLSSTQALLGEVAIGSRAEHTFTLTNTGDYTLFIQQDFLISGTPLMFPIASDTCYAQSLGVGSSCELTVGFEPTTDGEKDASILLITNASPIHVLGIDGVGVQPIAMSATALTSPFTPPAPAQAPAPRPSAPAVTLLPPASNNTEGHSASLSHSLAVVSAPRLRGSIARAALDTGLAAQCPVALPDCETVSVVTASIATGSMHRSARTRGGTRVLLGSVLAELHGGQSVRVRIGLSRRALALLRRRGHLRARIETIVRASGKLIDEHEQLVTLAPPRRDIDAVG